MTMKNFRARQSGFTMVELMVGVLVGLVATVVMFQVFAVSEGQKRTTTGAGDAQQNGLVSLFQMERDIRMSGYGLNLPALMGCNTYGRHESAGAFNLPLAPVTITNGAGGAPDSVTIIYGSSDVLSTPERLRNPLGTAAQVYTLNNRYGFTPGDVVVVGEQGKTCVVAQVSALTGTTDVAHTPGGSYLDSSGDTQTTKYNGTPSVFPGYIAWVRATNMGGRILNLGKTPTFVRYAVQNNALVAFDPSAPALDPVVIVDGVVQMQAQYGYDGNGDGRITTPTNVSVLNPAGADQWADTLPAGFAGVNWSRIVAVRLAIVARSLTPEKRNAANVCATTTVGPRWFARDPATAYNIDVSASDANWGCYRYRVFEVTVPIRNVAWFPGDSL